MTQNKRKPVESYHVFLTEKLCRTLQIENLLTSCTCVKVVPDGSRTTPDNRPPSDKNTLIAAPFSKSRERRISILDEAINQTFSRQSNLAVEASLSLSTAVSRVRAISSVTTMQTTYHFSPVFIHMMRGNHSPLRILECGKIPNPSTYLYFLYCNNVLSVALYCSRDTVVLYSIVLRNP